MKYEKNSIERDVIEFKIQKLAVKTKKTNEME